MMEFSIIDKVIVVARELVIAEAAVVVAVASADVSTSIVMKYETTLFSMFVTVTLAPSGKLDPREDVIATSK